MCYSRAVEATEGLNRNALSKLQKLQTEMSELNQEINQIKIQKDELNKKTAYTQNCLQGITITLVKYNVLKLETSVHVMLPN